MADDVARAAASEEVEDVRELVSGAVDVTAGNTCPGAVEVRMTVVATAVAPLLEGDSVMTDVMNAVVGAGAAAEAGVAESADDEAANEDAGAAALEDWWKVDVGGGADEDCTNDDDDCAGGCAACADDDGGGADEEKTDDVKADEGDAAELVKPRAEPTDVHCCQRGQGHEGKPTYLSSLMTLLKTFVRE